MKKKSLKRVWFLGQLISLFSLIILITSCDCNQNVSGIVLDKDTKQLIDSAYVQKVNQNYNHTYTDAKGEFKLNCIFGGLRKCPPMAVAITKKNYEIKNIEIENSRYDTIYLERIR
jgi:hypothetical protein